jgi:hypothetical protein
LNPSGEGRQKTPKKIQTTLFFVLVIAIVAAFAAKELWAQEPYCYQDTAKYINYGNGECDAGEGNGCAEASKRAIEICLRCQDPDTGDWSPCPDLASSVEGSTYGKLIHTSIL